jgi:protoheme IX farnesyltransferase
MFPSTLARVDGGALPLGAGGWRATLADYLDLTKPRIIVLLLITTLAAMIMAARGLPPPALSVWTLLGGALAAASAGTFNCVYDADVDALMRRTMRRPIPRGAISPARALAFGIVLGALSFTILTVFVNPLAAWLSLAGNAYYVLVYTIWLKRRTPQNIVIGGAAGSVPPLVGWAAVTGGIGAPAIALFLLIFLWTPPHFWALALMTDTDYGKAGIPMLPNVAGVARTKRDILAYTIVLEVFCITAVALHVFGMVFLLASLVLGGRFIFDAWKLLSDETRTYARRTFSFSLGYLALMSVAMVVDRIVVR